jgi:hypothetical protein
MTQKHHITYDPPWTVPLNGWQHKVITHLQRLKPTKKNREQVRAFTKAVNYEWLRIESQLDRINERNENP